MNVIEFAQKRLDEAIENNEIDNIKYWLAYLDGAKAQKREDDSKEKVIGNG